MNPNREVVITGLGVVSPIGVGREAFWQSLVEGQSGVCVQEPYSDSDLPFRIAAPVKDFEAKKYVKPRKALKIMCSPIQFGCAAASIAFEQSELDRESLDPDRVGIVFGTETFFADPNEVADVFRKCTIEKNYQHEKWGEFAMREIQPLWMLKYLPNMAASHISIALDARGPSNSICQGEASGLLALVEAADLIRRGVVDVVVAGGTGCQMALTAMLYRGIHLLSHRVSEPEKASRPFDVDRDGMVVGEGAAALVLESAEFAKARGAKTLATLTGWSRSYANPMDGDVFSDGLHSNFQAAIESAQLSTDDIGLFNAHASGSVANDLVEAKAIAKLGQGIPVTAHKSNFGKLGPGAPLVELAGAIMTLTEGTIPPTINCEQLDPRCEINVVTKPEPFAEGKSILKSSFSDTGQICSVVIS